MKVSDIMQKRVEFVSPETSILEAARLIFGRGINGLPVCKNKKIVGFVTERDILAKFYPSMQEYVEDPVHSSDFEGMENRVNDVLEMTVDKIMSKHPVTIAGNTPLLRAQSLMFIEKIGRLPVVDDKENLIGIISKSDIFKAIVGNKIPLAFEEDDRFYEWLGEYYDELYDWKKRLDSEIPGLVELFHKEKAKSILDIASSTGEHGIALAKAEFQVVGLESSDLMHSLAQKKQHKLPAADKDRVTFLKGPYKKNLENLPTMDAAIFMGNAIRPVMSTDEKILEDAVRVLNKENPILVFQLLNLEKIFRNNGFRDFTITEPGSSVGPKHALLSFYTKESDKDIVINRAVFSLTGRRWTFRGIRSTSVVNIDKKELIARLKKLGFSQFSFYGSSLYQPIFKHPFDPLESDWLTIVAKK
ncbi:MAG: CBS domain-containing protein [bacterium]|nr:CBS domain-containing protein [bacterium]